MDIMELGAIGELVGGGGVIASLGYLAVQIRQSTRAMRAAAYQSLVDHAADLNFKVASDPDFAGLLHSSQTDLPADDALDRLRLRAFARSAFRHFSNAFTQLRDGIILEHQWKEVSGTLPRLLESVTMRAEWELSRGDYDSGFVTYVDRVLAETRSSVP